VNSKLSWISRGITGLFSYFLASAPTGKLLLFEDVFDKDFHSFVFEHILFICLFLFLFYIIVEFTIYFRNIDKTLKAQCYNACRYIYRHLEKSISSDFAHNSRVTIFKAIHPNTEKVYLKAISRFQTKEPHRKTKLTFLPGEGIAGVCFATNSLILESMPEFEKDPEAYYRVSLNNYKLDKDMVDKLNTKSCFLLGIPIHCFDTERTWGVVVIDSTKKVNRPSKGFERSLEEIIKHYAAFFTEGDK